MDDDYGYPYLWKPRCGWSSPKHQHLQGFRDIFQSRSTGKALLRSLQHFLIALLAQPGKPHGNQRWFPVVSPENDLQMVDVHGCSSIFCICVGWLDDIPIYLTVDHHVSHHILSNIQNYDEKLKHLGISPIFDFNKVGIWIEFKRNAERKIDNKPARKLERI